MPLVEGLDGNGNPIYFAVQGQEPTVDFSASIVANDTTQEVAAANANRAYLYFQNKGANVMLINDVGDAGSGEPSCFQVPPGQSWPPPGYPIPITQINVSGTEGDAFLYREA
ncbi:MAG TPA: hypothetical protein VII48_07015 [Rhizomicrobium sp.]